MPVPNVTRIMLSVPRAGAELPFGHRGARRVVVDEHRRPPSVTELVGDVEVGHAVEVRRRAQHAVASHQAGNADPEAAALPQFVGQLDQRVDQCPEAAIAPRRGPLGGRHDVAAQVECNTLRLGSADVDADTPVGRRSPAVTAALTPRRELSAHAPC